MKRSILVSFVALSLCGCLEERPEVPASDSGISKVTVKVPTGSDGLTTEQRNVRERRRDRVACEVRTTEPAT